MTPSISTKAHVLDDSSNSMSSSLLAAFVASMVRALATGPFDDDAGRFVDMNGVVYGTPRPWMYQPWVRVVHPDERFHGRIHYYYNEVTRESVWEDPTNPPGSHR